MSSFAGIVQIKFNRKISEQQEQDEGNESIFTLNHGGNKEEILVASRHTRRNRDNLTACALVSALAEHRSACR
jgi:hypothetical protein